MSFTKNIIYEKHSFRKLINAELQDATNNIPQYTRDIIKLNTRARCDDQTN